MSYSYQQLIASTQLTTAVATYYTAAKIVQVTKATLSNPTGTARWAKMWIVPALGAAGDGNAILPSYIIPLDEAVDVWSLIGHALAVGDTIQAQAEANAALTLFLSGLVFG